MHAFICLLALLLARIVEHQARGLGRREGLSGLLERLGDVRLARMLHSSGKKGGRIARYPMKPLSWQGIVRYSSKPTLVS